MGESAVLFHSYSFAAPRNDSHEDHTVHALSQSISFGRFMTENLEWGKWSSFSHKKYVDEAEKYSKPGSVAQKKAFFDAYYKKIADAKKSKASSNDSKPESVSVLLDTMESLTKDEVKVQENVETELGLNSIEEDEEIGRKSVAVLEEDDEEEETERESVAVVEQEDEESVVDKHVVADDLQDVHEVLDKIEEKENHIEDGYMLKKIGSNGGKEEEERVVNKNLETPEKAISEKPITSSSAKKNEKSVHQKFSLLRFLMGNTKTQDQNQTKKKRKANKKQKKAFLCMCFSPEMVGETEGPAKVYPRTAETVGDKM